MEFLTWSSSLVCCLFVCWLCGLKIRFLDFKYGRLTHVLTLDLWIHLNDLVWQTHLMHSLWTSEWPHGLKVLNPPFIGSISHHVIALLYLSFLEFIPRVSWTKVSNIVVLHHVEADFWRIGPMAGLLRNRENGYRKTVGPQNRGMGGRSPPIHKGKQKFIIFFCLLAPTSKIFGPLVHAHTNFYLCL